MAAPRTYPGRLVAWGGRDVVGPDGALRRRVSVMLAVGRERECLTYTAERPAGSGPVPVARRIAQARHGRPVESPAAVSPGMWGRSVDPPIGPYEAPPGSTRGGEAVVRRLNARVSYAAQLDAAGLPAAAARARGCRQTFRTATCTGCHTLASAIPLDPCGDRLCPLCAAARSATHARRVADRAVELAEAAEEKQKPYGLKLLTFTIENVPRIDRSTWQLMRESFARLLALVEHRHPGAIRGGVRSIEVTWSPDRGWHPHVHALIDADYVPQADLSDAWLLATAGRGYVVDVRAVRGAGTTGSGVRSIRRAAREVAKYATKVLEIDSPAALLELRAALPRVRLIDAWGSFRGALAAEEDDDSAAADDEPKKCRGCGGTEYRVEERRYSGRELLRIHLAAHALACLAAEEEDVAPEPVPQGGVP